MLSKLKKIFTAIGLDLKESELLYILLQHDSLRVRDLAKKAHLNRTSTYGIIKGLSQKGLVSAVTKYGITEYQSIEPALLPSYIERQEEQLRERKKELQTTLPQLQQIRNEKNIFPRLYFFEGIEGLKQAYEDTLENNQGKLVEQFTGADALFEEHGEEKWIRYYIKKRAALGIRCAMIAPSSKWSRWAKANDATALRTTKLISEKFSFATEVVLYDNKVGLFSFSKDKPMAVIIEDENINQTLKTIFQYVDGTIPN